MNPPLPTFDMMTGQQVIQGSVMPPETAAMIVNESDVVHVQLLDRMVVVPSAIINVSLQSSIVTAEPMTTGYVTNFAPIHVLRLLCPCRDLLFDIMSPVQVARLPTVSMDRLTSCL